MTPKRRRRGTDKMRLDWLDHIGFYDRFFQRFHDGFGKNIRQAIDEAMEAECEEK